MRMREIIMVIIAVMMIAAIEFTPHSASSLAPQTFFSPPSFVMNPRRDMWDHHGAFYGPILRSQMIGRHLKASVKFVEQKGEREQRSNNLEQPHHEYSSYWKPICSLSNDTIHNILLCGDGDLSYSASISEYISQSDIELTATVLEEATTHEDVYANSKLNQNLIRKAGHKVIFGIDATNLNLHFQPGVTTFDRIQFNFPHWRGKMNHRYNRELINGFLKSSSEFLSPNGEIHVALCQDQGGSSATTLNEWKVSWTPSMFAGEHGLLLYNVCSYQPMYNLSSHRGKDRGFNIGNQPEMYIFGKTKEPLLKVPKAHQLCTRHELHVMIPNIVDSLYDSESEGVTTSSLSPYKEQSLSSSQIDSLFNVVDDLPIIKIIQGIVPEGIRVEVPDRKILRQEDTGCIYVVYFIVYCGEYRALRRSEVDTYRHDLEIEVEKHVALRENRKGKLVSKPFPYSVLDSILKANSSLGLFKKIE